MLLKHFTQNIDCLDREAGVPGSHIIEAHGSFAKQSCTECKSPYPDSKMRTAVRTSTPPYCEKSNCGGLVKPDIVFFGEALPAEFFAAKDLPYRSDLAIIMGTSLTVQPFASLPSLIPENVPRVLINKEQVGGLGSRADDVLLLGDCDEQVRRLASACGWGQELEDAWAKTGGQKSVEKPKSAEEPKSKDEKLESEIDRLTCDIDKSLSMSQKFDKETRESLPQKVEEHLAGKTEKSESSVSKSTPQSLSVQDKSTATDKSSDQESKADSETDLKHVYPHMKSNLS